MNLQRDLAAFADELASIFDRLAADVGKQLIEANANKGLFLEPILGFFHAVNWTVRLARTFLPCVFLLKRV